MGAVTLPLLLTTGLQLKLVKNPGKMPLQGNGRTGQLVRHDSRAINKHANVNFVSERKRNREKRE